VHGAILLRNHIPEPRHAWYPDPPRRKPSVSRVFILQAHHALERSEMGGGAHSMMMCMAPFPSVMKSRHPGTPGTPAKQRGAATSRRTSARQPAQPPPCVSPLVKFKDLAAQTSNLSVLGLCQCTLHCIANSGSKMAQARRMSIGCEGTFRLSCLRARTAARSPHCLTPSKLKPHPPLSHNVLLLDNDALESYAPQECSGSPYKSTP
jgi:hypothetical protein